jgi:hypothetical protein
MDPHLRPNLMSAARRGGHEDSILAKLEREPARRRDSGTGVRLAWYGGAALLAVGLTATLAWLAAGSGPAPLELARASDPPFPLEATAPPSTPVKTAVIVDAPPEPLAAAPITPLPPAAPAPMSASASVATPLATPAPVPPLRLLEPAGARPALAKAAPAPVKAAQPRKAEARASAAARPRAQAKRSATRQAARPAKTINPARSGEQDDSDVALISAVISHANSLAAPEDGEPNAAPCADESCRTRPAR